MWAQIVKFGGGLVAVAIIAKLAKRQHPPTPESPPPASPASAQASTFRPETDKARPPGTPTPQVKSNTWHATRPKRRGSGVVKGVAIATMLGGAAIAAKPWFMKAAKPAIATMAPGVIKTKVQVPRTTGSIIPPSLDRKVATATPAVLPPGDLRPSAMDELKRGTARAAPKYGIPAGVAVATCKGMRPGSLVEARGYKIRCGSETSGDTSLAKR